MPDTLSFSNSLYDHAAVVAAAAAFEAIATLQVHASDTETRVQIDWIDPEVPDLLDHFCNHVLHHTIVASRQREGAGQ